MLNNRNKADRIETLQRVLEVVKNAGKPVSIEYVAYNTSISWATMKAILFRLVADGKLTALDTTKSWIFYIKEGST